MADTNDTPNVVTAVPADSGVPLQRMQTGYVPEDIEYAHLNQPDTLDVAAASWRSYTLVGQLLNSFQDRDVNARPDAQFNPYNYIETNKDKYQDLLPLVTSGSLTFDGIDSQAAFDAWVGAQRRNIQDRQSIAAADTWKSVVTMPVAMLDATLLLGPVGEAAGAAMTGRMGVGVLSGAARGAIAGGTEIGIQQAAVSALNDSQTAEEAFMNIGVGMTLGAGLGAIFRHAKPDNALNAGNPNNPLHPDNLDRSVPINEHQIGQLPEEGAVFGADSIGAARSTADTDTLIATSKNPIARAVDWATTLGSYTPLQRLGSYSNALTRDTMLRLMDTGGLLTRAMAAGKSTGLEAETLKTIYEQQMSNVRRRVDSVYRSANADLGQSGLRTSTGNVLNTITQGSRDINVVPQQAFNEAVSLIQRGSNARAANDEISQAVMDRLTQAGLSLDQAKAVHRRVYEAEKIYHDAYDGMKDEAVRQGLLDPEKLVEGRYGMPQRWMREGIDANAERLKGFLMEHLETKPTDDWLRENGFIADPNVPRGAGEEPLPASWDELKKSGDDTTVNSVLRQWAGEQNEFNNQYLQSKLADYQQRQLKAQDKAATVLGFLKETEGYWRDAKLREMRLASRDIERRSVLRKVASAQLKSQRASEKVQAALNRLGGDESVLGQLQKQLVDGGLALDEAGAAVAKARERHAAAKAAFTPNDEGQSLVAALRGKITEKRGENASLLAEKRDVLGELKDVSENLGGSELPRAKNPLNQQRDALNAQSRANREEIAKAREQIREALEERRAAQAELGEANAGFDKLAKQQADVRRWHDAATKEVNTIIEHEGDALLEPGLRKQMDDHLAAVDELKKHLNEARDARRFAYDIMKLTGMEARAAAKAADRASRQLQKVAFQARKGMSDMSPLTKYVDGLVNDLRGAERAPRGVLLDKSPTSGRLKERQFQFDFGEYNWLVDNGFLAGNADDAFQGYMKDLGGQLAAHRALGGRQIDDVLREIQGDYDAAIGSELNLKKRSALQAEKLSALEDVKHAHDRILGKYDLKDHNGAVWTADRMRQLGVVRYMGGFVFSSIGDLATAAFSAPGSLLRAVAFKGARDYQYILRQAAKGDKDAEELKMILGSLETGAHLNSSDRALGRGEASDLLGFGTGRTRQVTRAIETAMNTMSDYGNKLSLMKGWSDNIRRTAGLVQLSNIRKWVGKYDTLDRSKLVQLSALGIGEEEAKRLNVLFSKHGTEQRQGLFSPGITKWLNEPDGEHMKYVLESALIKAQRRASYTSGYGNQPLLMDKWYGKLFLQFQSMALQFSNNFIRAGVQYGFVTGDHMRFASALGTAIAAGVLMNAIATFRKGGNIEDQEPQQFAYNVVQRSGLLGVAGSYTDSAVKLMDPVLNQHLGWTLGGGASKFSQNSWLANLMGPWLSNVETLQGIGANAVDGDFDNVGKKALQLVPLNQQIQMIARLLSTNQ
ncbi:hypothetical protein WL21_09820 [Burkholderia ubonensis]|uniref:hypothetical protein n=1 Tax=Burkholderia ubonensis TaxID=101571 RepID=UPI0007527C04|nr:hypothetical protein [Burkholderia ubonensis]KVO83320.1 hypothetical protein WJ81_23040 [Burkholderia ubonensis]KVZ58967.1 hypothetical protein WL20_20440 [Burkholderia ubonensis]KVZ70595.1 hypothetical protein WL21_09820 [Burkholderia ubonensis]